MSTHHNIKIIATFEEAIKKNKRSIALTDYNGGGVSFGMLAEEIGILGVSWKNSGLSYGDKVAIFAPNSARWLEVYLATMLNGYVAVLLPSNSSQDNVVQILSQSKCRILYTTQEHASNIHDVLADVEIRDIDSLEILFHCKDLIPEISLNTLPSLANASDEDSVCTILYTSGSMGIPQGAMITYKNLYYQIRIVSNWMKKYQKGRFQVNFLPFTHIYGLICDALTPLCMGTQLVILGPYTSPWHMLKALQCYKPSIFFTIPLVVDGMVKIIENQHIGGCNDLDVLLSLGGNLKVIITGGTPMNQDLENRLIHTLKLPFVTGYGTTECGPLSAGIVGEYQSGSCGKILDTDAVRIKVNDISDMSGEIQINGENVFAGYFNNISATKASFTDDGWFKTGDIGYIDEDGNLFITGRCKDMLLTSNGENIYPEEVESTMNASPYVKESILVQRGEKFYAIVVPDREKAEADGIDAEGLNKKIDGAVREASKKLPGFTIISGFELRDEPLERTPKGSLKRYLYSDGIKEN